MSSRKERQWPRPTQVFLGFLFVLIAGAFIKINFQASATTVMGLLILTAANKQRLILVHGLFGTPIVLLLLG